MSTPSDFHRLDSLFHELVDLDGEERRVRLEALRGAEPERRYASVEQLFADLERYLEGQPVLARPDSLGYRMSRVVRRHRAAERLRGAFARLRGLEPPDEPALAAALVTLANHLEDVGGYDESERLFREAVEILRRQPDPEPDLLAFGEATEVYLESLGRDHYWVSIARFNRARGLFRLDRFAEAVIRQGAVASGPDR